MKLRSLRRRNRYSPACPFIIFQGQTIVLALVNLSAGQLNPIDDGNRQLARDMEQNPLF